MKRVVAHAAVAAFGLALFVSAASAQLNSLPVYVSPKGGSGLNLAADLGRGINDESGKNTAVGVRAGLGLGPIMIGAGLGTVNPDVSSGATSLRESKVQYMGNLALRLFGGGLNPVSISLQAGVGFLKITELADTREVNIPIALGVGFSLPTPVFSFDPWIAPRYTLRRVDTQLLTDPLTQKGFGVSAGVNLAFLMGLGIHAAIDIADLSTETVGTMTIPSASPVVFGVGLHYNISIPGLPGVPMVPGV